MKSILAGLSFLFVCAGFAASEGILRKVNLESCSRAEVVKHKEILAKLSKIDQKKMDYSARISTGIAVNTYQVSHGPASDNLVQEFFCYVIEAINEGHYTEDFDNAEMEEYKTYLQWVEQKIQ